MKLRVLGSSGGIGGRHLRTTSFLVDHDILIDAGTGVADLGFDELCAIDHIFLTHAHLDHVASLPMLVDTVGDARGSPIHVHALAETIGALRSHVFNWQIWPDFTNIPSADEPWLRFHALTVGETVDLGGRLIRALPAEHTIPAVGYHLASGWGSLVFSGDSGPCPAFWEAVDGIADLRHLIVETAFPNDQRWLAERSRHLCPEMLGEELQRLTGTPGVQIHVSHLKPGVIEQTMDELEAIGGGRHLKMLEGNAVFEF